MSLLPKFVTADDVRAAKARVDSFARNINRSLASCSRLPPSSRRSWADFYVAWRHFADNPPSNWHAAAEFDETEKYEEHVRAWEAYVSQFCTIAGPRMTKPADVDAFRFEGTVKVVAIAGAVIAGALAIREVVRG